MPKHHRSTSSSHYANNASTSFAPPSLYGQQRIAIPSNYYTVGTSAAPPSLPLSRQPQQQQQQQQQAPRFEPYTTSSSAPAVTLPAQHRPSSGAWTPADDRQLVVSRMQGLNWGQIHANYFPLKSSNACRKRHERLMERRGSDDWDSRKLQRLAKDYMSMRKEIWMGLAEKTGEKWTVVEQKCLSSGLKNLQSASRAAARRERLDAAGVGPLSTAAAAAAAAAASATGYDDDSGISGIALTPVDELDASYSSPDTTSSSGGYGGGGGPRSVASDTVASASASFSQHIPPHAQAHLQSYGLGPYGYGVGGGGSGHNQHGYSSSVSSSASAGAGGHHGYAGQAGMGPNQGNSPYLHEQRLSAADMGIDAIINRPRGRGM